MSYYENSQWSASGQSSWENVTPPVRSGASSTVPREDSASAFVQQLEEVDRAIDNMVKSGKMFGQQGRPPRMGSASGRPGSMGEFSDARGGPPSNLQNFYATQRHQSSRGSNEAEQMVQAKRRLAAQRERELRNYHQEQQFNRTVHSEMAPFSGKPDRTQSPSSNLSEEERRNLIARQRSALYGEGPFAEKGGYIDETGASRPGVPSQHQSGPGALRGQSPMTNDYRHTPPADKSFESRVGSQSAGPGQRSPANSNASHHSNPTGSKAVFEAPGGPSSRASTTSPGGTPGSNPPPIGTRPTAASSNPSSAGVNSALNKRSTTPQLPSPLSQGYNAQGGNEAGNTTRAPSNPSSAATEGAMGLGWGGRSGSVWGNGKAQASVWG